jgi:hypothetical protein
MPVLLLNGYRSRSRCKFQSLYYFIWYVVIPMNDPQS